jgi:hypothetical protein
LINHLQSIYNTWGRPVWLTEFSTVDWGGTATWTEEDNYRFLAEFMWRSEDLLWFKRYAMFIFTGNPPANPWDRVGPRSDTLKTDGSLTAFGELYAAWDADRTLGARAAYFLHNRATSHRLRASSLSNTASTGDIRRSDVSAQFAFVPASANRWYIVSLRDGRRLRWNGTALDLSPPGTSDPTVEWSFNGPDSAGHYFIDHPGTSKTLRMNRSNDGNGAPTSLGYAMDNFGSPSDNTRWRFIKPHQPVEVAAPPVVGLLTATAGFLRVTLSWAATTATDFLRYAVYRRTGGSGAYVRIAANVTTTNYVDSNVIAGANYQYVITALDWLENESAYSTEASAMPLGPNLAIAASGGSVALGWPASPRMYRLLSATNLNPPIVWSPESGAALSNGLWNFAAPIGSNGARFFKLQYP